VPPQPSCANLTHGAFKATRSNREMLVRSIRVGLELWSGAAELNAPEDRSALPRLSHASSTPPPRLLHASSTPPPRLSHASSTPPPRLLPASLSGGDTVGETQWERHSGRDTVGETPWEGHSGRDTVEETP
jgi:hypothetical protein